MYLTGFAADTPARAKVGKFLGVSAYRACPWCIWVGEKRPPPERKGTYFSHKAKAYSELVDGQRVDRSFRPGDPGLKLNNSAMWECGSLAEEAYKQSKHRVRNYLAKLLRVAISCKLALRHLLLCLHSDCTPL